MAERFSATSAGCDAGSGAMPAAPPPVPSAGELLDRLRRSLPTPPVRAAGDRRLVPSRKGWIGRLIHRPPAATMAPGRPPVRRWRRYRLLSLLVLAGVAGAHFHDTLWQAYRGAYPSDPLKQEALHTCSLVNPAFVRFLEFDRAACYAQMQRDNAGAATADTGAMPRPIAATPRQPPALAPSQPGYAFDVAGQTSGPMPVPRASPGPGLGRKIATAASSLFASAAGGIGTLWHGDWHLLAAVRNPLTPAAAAVPPAGPPTQAAAPGLTRLARDLPDTTPPDAPSRANSAGPLSPMLAELVVQQPPPDAAVAPQSVRPIAAASAVTNPVPYASLGADWQAGATALVGAASASGTSVSAAPQAPAPMQLICPLPAIAAQPRMEPRHSSRRRELSDAAPRARPARRPVRRPVTLAAAEAPPAVASPPRPIPMLLTAPAAAPGEPPPLLPYDGPGAVRGRTDAPGPLSSSDYPVMARVLPLPAYAQTIAGLPPVEPAPVKP